MKPKHLIILFVGSIAVFYTGVFLGDLGGVGGYDGFAPRSFYEKVNMQPGNETMFHLAESGSIVLLGLGTLMFLVAILCLIVFCFQKVKARGENS